MIDMGILENPATQMPITKPMILKYTAELASEYDMNPAPAITTQIDMINFIFPLASNLPMIGEATATPRPAMESAMEKVVLLIPKSFVTGTMNKLCREFIIEKPANIIKKPHNTTYHP